MGNGGEAFKKKKILQENTFSSFIFNDSTYSMLRSVTEGGPIVRIDRETSTSKGMKKKTHFAAEIMKI